LPVTLVPSNTLAGLTLSWPSWAVGFAPQSATNLAAGFWTTNGLAPALAHDFWSLAIAQTNGLNFFRLQR
jgi:hypothetical protein